MSGSDRTDGRFVACTLAQNWRGSEDQPDGGGHDAQNRCHDRGQIDRYEFSKALAHIVIACGRSADSECSGEAIDYARETGCCQQTAEIDQPIHFEPADDHCAVLLSLVSVSHLEKLGFQLVLFHTAR